MERIDKVAPIGRHKARELREIPEDERTADQASQLEQFGDNELTDAHRANWTGYVSALKADKPEIAPMDTSASRLYHASISALGWESSDLLCTLCYYFAGDEKFFSSPILSNESKPSFEKGLLIVGGYGIGKTASLKQLSQLCAGTQSAFPVLSAAQVVYDYECNREPFERSQFVKKMSRGTKCFDDVKAEAISNNYGKRELFRDILEHRANQGAKTYMTCNYPDALKALQQKHPGMQPVEFALNEFLKRYGSRVYDRLFSMCNIIECKIEDSYRV